MPISYHRGSRDSLDETPRVVQNLAMDARNHHRVANQRKISAVIFDYGEVLCCPPSLEHLARMAEVFHMRREEFFPAYIASHARRNFAWLRHFDCLTLSCEARAIKPDLAIYRRCLAALGVPPSETLFIDDRISNIEAAEILGIVGLPFQSIEKLCDDLRGLGFPISPVI